MDEWMRRELGIQSFTIEYPKSPLPPALLISPGNGEATDKILCGMAHELLFDFMRGEAEDSELHAMLKTHMPEWYSWFMKTWYNS